jgi:hypothetical protein
VRPLAETTTEIAMTKPRRLKIRLLLPKSESNISSRPVLIDIEIARNKRMSVVIKVINKSLGTRGSCCNKTGLLL